MPSQDELRAKWVKEQQRIADLNSLTMQEVGGVMGDLHRCILTKPQTSIAARLRDHARASANLKSEYQVLSESHNNGIFMICSSSIRHGSAHRPRHRLNLLFAHSNSNASLNELN